MDLKNALNKALSMVLESIKSISNITDIPPVAKIFIGLLFLLMLKTIDAIRS